MEKTPRSFPVIYSTQLHNSQWNEISLSQGPTNKMAGVAVERNP